MSAHYSLSRRVLAGVGAVLLIGFAITAAGALAARASDHRAATEGMRRRADLTTEVVRGEILRYQDTLTMVASSLSAQQVLKRSDFAMITQPLLSTRLRGASGVVLLVPATTRSTSSVQAYWRGHGASGLTLKPTGSGTQHIYTIFSRTLDGVPSVLGRDVGQTPQLTQVLKLVRSSGRLAVSEPYVLSKDRQLAPDRRQLSLVLAAEVNDPGGAPRGWVAMGLRSGDLLGQTLKETGQDALNATFTTSRADGKPQTLVREISGRASDARLTRRAVIPVGQHQWTLIMQGTGAAANRDADGGALARDVLVGGPTITLLLAGLIFVLMTSRQRALLAVDQATAELREADQRFRLAFEQAHTGMSLVDMRPGGEGKFLRVNQALCRLLGYSAEDLLNRTVSDITHPEERAQDGAVMADLISGQKDSIVLEKRVLHADGHVLWVKVNVAVIRTADERPSYGVTQIENITERRAETERLSAMALQDPLTGLGNRLLFDDRMTQAVARAARTRHLVGVVFCDLDLFKGVNDTHGHAAGDAVLRAVADRIRETVRPADTVARLGGDEFVVLCEDLETPAGCEHVSWRIHAALDHPIELPDGAWVTVRCSLGSATASTANGDIDVVRLLHDADTAMYRSKNAVIPGKISRPA